MANPNVLLYDPVVVKRWKLRLHAGIEKNDAAFVQHLERGVEYLHGATSLEFVAVFLLDFKIDHELRIHHIAESVAVVVLHARCMRGDRSVITK